MIYIKEPPEPEYESLPHDRYDIVAKDALQKYPDDILRAILERDDFTFIELLEGEFATVEVRRVDGLIKARIGNDDVLVHIEFQVGDSSPLDMARRNVGYLGRCYEKYGLPILSHVIYLRPDAGRNDPGGYWQELPNHRFIVEYKVIRLAELDGKEVFDKENLGLTPFAPLMKPPSGMDGLQWAIQCNERTKALSLPTNIRSNLLVSQWIMGGLILPKQAISGFISEEIMQESSFFEYLDEYFDETRGKEHYQRGVQQGIQQGREQGIQQGREQGIQQGREQGIQQGREQGIQQGAEQGARQNAAKNLFAVLESRFDDGAVQSLRPAVEKIQDLQCLEELFQEALRAGSFESFARVLGMNGNEQ